MTFAAMHSPARACLATLGWVLIFSAAAASGVAAATGPERIESVILELAGPETGGRAVGSESLDLAAEQLAARLAAFGTVERQSFDHAGHTLHNLILKFEGTDPAAGWVVLGAHYDGQGKGVYGEPNAGKVHFSADDNASGVAVALETVHRLREGFDPPQRGVLFVLFTGEERGLLGSRHFVEHSGLALDEIRAMVNLDTVGRLSEGGLTIFGVESARSLAELLRGLDSAFGLEPTLIERSSGVSDDAPFAERGIATLHLFTGAHADYHRPGDTADMVDLEGLDTLADFTVELVDYLAQSDTELDFVPAGAQQAVADPARSTEGRRRVSFGSIPDFQRQEGGVLLTGVIPGSPAAEAGLAKGDVIVGFAGAPIEDLTDYSEAMKRHAPGDEVEVVFLREGERQSVQVTLVERK